MTNLPSEDVLLFPHQESFVKAVKAQKEPRRVVTLARPGSGRAVAVASALAAVLDDSDLSSRVAVITGWPWLEDWTAVLRRWAGREFSIIHTAEYLALDASHPTNPWQHSGPVVLLDELIERSDRIRDFLASDWEMVVLDDAEILPDELGHEVWLSNGVRNAVAITNASRPPRWTQHDSRSLSLVLDVQLAQLPPESVVPARLIEEVAFTPTVDEEHLARELTTSTEHMGQDGPFWTALLNERWKSSWYATAQTLRRALVLGTKTVSPFRESEWSRSLEVTEPEPSNIISNIGLLDSYRSRITDTIDRIEAIPTDSRWASCEELVVELAASAARPIVVHTAFADTADFLIAGFEDDGLLVCGITPAMSPSERADSIGIARLQGAVLVVALVAFGNESLNFVDHVVHHDLPHESSELAKRFITAEWGSRRPEVTHHFIIANGDGEDTRHQIAEATTTLRSQVPAG